MSITINTHHTRVNTFSRAHGGAEAGNAERLALLQSVYTFTKARDVPVFLAVRCLAIRMAVLWENLST